MIDNNKDLTIFYSWQSDLPNKTNRSFIEECLELAIKELKKTDSIKIIPRIDKDTAGVSGSPNIATTILNKIDSAFLVVSDLSIINSNVEDEKRKTPNPNVLYELGYAVKSLGIENVLMLQNTFFGGPENLPFDLKMHRIITYECSETDKVAEKKKILVQKLKLAIESLIKKDKNVAINKVDFEELLTKDLKPLVLENALKPHVDELLTKLKETDLFSYSPYPVKEEIEKRKLVCEKLTSELQHIFFTLGKWIDKDLMSVVVRQFERLQIIPKAEGRYYVFWRNFAYYPSALIFYSFGLGSIYNKNIESLKPLLNVDINEDGHVFPSFVKLNSMTVFSDYNTFTKSGRKYPGSDTMFSLFKNLFKDSTDEQFGDVFDSFEYLLSLMYGAWDKKTDRNLWVPKGSYTWRGGRKIWEKFSTEFSKNDERWLYFDLFDMDVKLLKELINEINEKIDDWF